LVGALAAMLSKGQKIGAVCGAESNPSIWRYGEGYKAGAAYADQLKGTPTEVSVMYHASKDGVVSEKKWGETTTQGLVEQGVDVIFGCGGEAGRAALLAGAQAEVYVIGAETDQYLTLPDAAPWMLSSAVKQVKPGVFELIQFSKEGNFPSGNYFGDVNYAPYHDLEGEVSQAVQTMMGQIHAGLRDGSIRTNVSPLPE
jgi:basic membrane protein A